MRRGWIFLILLVFKMVPAYSQIELTGSNGEVLYIELTGVTDLQRQQDPQGNWTDNYTYRRSSYDFEMSIRPHIVIKGGHCVPNGYQYGQFSLRTKLVTGFTYNAPLARYIPLATDAADKLDMSKASGSVGFSGEVDLTRSYRTRHSLSIEVYLTMADYNCDTLSTVSFQFWLYPEYTFGELEFTRLANLSNADQIFSLQANCNACDRKGVPGFTVSSSSLLPFFSDQDYAYRSLGPDVDFTRSFTLPGRSGMFGDGWRFFYEQRLVTLKGLAEFTGGSGEAELFRPTGDTVEPIRYEANGSVRKRLTWHPSLSRFELFDPVTKQVAELELFASSGDTLQFRLGRLRDLYGNALKVSYNEQDRIISVTDAAGRSTRFDYDAPGRCIGISLPDGRSCSYGYDSRGRLVHVTDLYGNDVGFVHDDRGFITVMRVNQDSASFTYESPGGGLQQLVASRNLDGNTTTYAVELAGVGFQINRITDPTGVAKLYEFNNQTGSTLSVKDAASGAKRTMVYDGNRMLTDLTLPAGGNAHTEYDSLKRTILQTDFRGMQTRYTYDSLDNITSMKDAEGNTWRWTYDGYGGVAAVITPLGRVMAFTHDTSGLLKTLQYGSQPPYTFSYDAMGNLISTGWPNGGVSGYEYSSGGLRCTAYTDPLGNRSHFAYDALDRLTTLTHPDQQMIRVQHNCCAPTAVTYENGSTIKYERDPLLRITKITDAENNHWQYSLDEAGRLTSEIRPDNASWMYAYDPSGRLTTKRDPFGEEATFGYDLNSMVNTITDQSGNTTHFTRSENGNIVARTAGSNTVTYSRDSLDRISFITNARGQTIDFAYNADGLVESRIAEGIQDIRTYDNLDRLVVLASAANTVTYEYNPMHAVTRIDYSTGNQYRFGYDLCNNLVKTVYSDNSEVGLIRDSRNRVVSVRVGGDSAWFEYDAASHLRTLHRSNGLSTIFRRDGNSRVIALCLCRQGDTLMKREFTRNGMGFIIRESRQGIGSHDSVFLQADTGGYYRPGNQMSMWQGETYSYDADGNLIQVEPGRFTAVYDALNRLTEWSQESGSTKATYVYNAAGMVASKHFQSGAATADWNYYYDAGNRMIALEQAGGEVSWKFYYKGSTLVAGRRNTELYFYHFDHLGNTVALSDRAGNIVQTYSYDAWGKILADSGSVEQPFKYSGAWGVMHEYAHLYRMHYRFYDAWTGRFIQADPSEFAGGINLYRYAMNNPLNFIDPSGLVTDEEMAYEAEYEERRDSDPNYDAGEHLKDMEAIGSLCNLLAYLIPGAKAGQAHAEEKPSHEVAIEAGKKLSWGANVPFYVADLYNRLFKAAQKDSPTLRRQYGDPDRPPVGGGRKTVGY